MEDDRDVEAKWLLVFRSLFPKKSGLFSENEENRRFRSCFGCGYHTCETVLPMDIEHAHLLMCLWMMKVYTSWDVGSVTFGMSRRSLQRIVFSTLHALDEKRPEVLFVFFT